MVEKYTLFLQRRFSKGDIMPESRSNPQNKALQLEFERCRLDGTGFTSANQIIEQIPSKKLKFRTKKDNIAGLQLCDLMAHPSHYKIRETLGHEVSFGPFGARVAKLLVDRKYDRSAFGKISGYGMKPLP